MLNQDGSEKSDDTARPDRLEEILAELMRANDRGESIDRKAWSARYPEFSDELEQYFDKLNRLDALVDPFRDVAAQALNIRCPHCHNPIELLEDVRLEEVSCPTCGSSFSLAGDQTNSHFAPGEKMIGHFQLLDRVGIGAFGSVWKARDTQLDRIVAVKIPRNRQLDESQTELFLRDARAAAQLKHPNIVGVHEIGKLDDTIYIISDFIQGASLKEWADAKRITPREAAQLCVKIATALHHAHESGVIHRDLKPSNIMMDSDGEPHIVDFGLAKRESGEITMTIEGQVLGTPAYMSPEQARGESHKVDGCADIYSLGVILFELITRELPFRGDKQMLILQILNEEPARPTRLNSQVPRDLETICLKCLEKEPHRRFSSTSLLADELNRFLRHEPIQARPIGGIARAWRWSRRNRTVASLSICLAIVIIAVAIISPVIALRQTQLANDKTKLASDLESSLVKQREATKTARTRTKLAERGAYNLQLSRVQNVSRHDPIHARRLLADTTLCPLELREFTWGLLDRFLEKQLSEFSADTGLYPRVTMSGDAKTIATVSKSRRLGRGGWGPGPHSTIRLWSTIDQELIVEFKVDYAQFQCSDFSPDGKIFAYGNGNAVRLWRIDRREEDRALEGFQNAASAVAFSPDGTTLAVACGKTLQLWDLKSNQNVKDFAGHSSSISHLAYSLNGRLLAIQDQDRIRLWDVIDDVKQVDISFIPKQTLGFSADDSTLVTEDSNYFIRFWDVETGAERPATGLLGSYGWGNAAISPTENAIAVVGDGEIFLWDLNESRVTWRRGRKGTFEDIAHGAALSADGMYLATTTANSKIQLWNFRQNHSDIVLSDHSDSVTAIAYSPNGKLIASAGWDKEIRISEIATGKTKQILKFQLDSVFGLAFSPDGKLLASSEWLQSRDPTKNPTIKIWNVATGDELIEIPAKGGVEKLEFSSNGQVLASGGNDVKLWDVKSGQLLATLPIKCHCLVFLAGDQELVVASGKNVSLWDWSSSQMKSTYSLDAHPMAFSRDGNILACSSNKSHRNIELWDWRNHEIQATLVGHDRQVETVAFSPDGQTIASEGMDMTVRLWDPVTGQERMILDGIHGDEITDVLFSPDGKSLASASMDNTVRVWRVNEKDE